MVDVRQLNELALNGLVPMFDAAKQLFCSRLKREGSQLVREGFSHRYTMMSLLGLHKAEVTGLGSPIDVRAALDGLLQHTTWIDNLGDLGLLLWLCASAAPERLSDLVIQDALTRYSDGREGRTMELAWFLTGLAHVVLTLPATRLKLTDLAGRTYELLARNQGNHGIFGHQATWGTVSGVFRGRVGSFADQVYPIYALTRFAQAYNVPHALEIAQNCAEAICRLQGPFGQWWWHYNALTGKVAQRYPVYAVHQDGMAPMALFALGDAAQSDFSGPIRKGLSWINGNNELNFDLRHASGAIWRSIYRPKRWKKYGSEFRDFVRPGRAAGPISDLKILFECRPYHLGWLLYAFAGRDCECGGRRYPQ